MANKFFRLAAAFLLFSLTIFAPVDLWAQEEAAASTDSEPVEEAVAEPEAAPVEAPKSPDHNSSRYEISAIEDAAEGKNYYITRDENNNFSFVQKLSWNKIPDIKNYRITIERMTDAGWVQVMEKDLFENKIEVSLEAGKYRFQVSVINLFDQLEKSSKWQNFEVLKALQPGIDNLQTDSLFLNRKKADGTFTLNGKNLTENTIFTMEKKDCEPPRILYGKVLSLSEDGSSAQVQFDISQVDEGKYEIYA
ncbi:MAG: fibronectin type III domain-containing protein, partial [Treponema sp.]|nr:fibronectin type III domain-containing protein [Treponema sp.]